METRLLTTIVYRAIDPRKAPHKEQSIRVKVVDFNLDRPQSEINLLTGKAFDEIALEDSRWELIELRQLTYTIDR